MAVQIKKKREKNMKFVTCDFIKFVECTSRARAAYKRLYHYYISDQQIGVILINLMKAWLIFIASNEN
jgi:hypothetical protein